MNDLVIFKIEAAAGYWLFTLGSYWIARLGYWRSLLVGTIFGGMWDLSTHRLANADERWRAPTLDNSQWAILVGLWIVLALILVVISWIDGTVKSKEFETKIPAPPEPPEPPKKLADELDRATEWFLYCDEMYHKAIAEQKPSEIIEAARFLQRAKKDYFIAKNNAEFSQLTFSRVVSDLIFANVRVAYFTSAVVMSVIFARSWLFEEYL